jgi:hypothetical protein
MPMSDPNVVDGMGVDPVTGAFSMYIWEERSWQQPSVLLHDLEQKVNAYIRFIFGGQLDDHSDYKGRPTEIRVFFQNKPPSSSGPTFRALVLHLSAQKIGFKAFHGPDERSPTISWDEGQ